MRYWWTLLWQHGWVPVLVGLMLWLFFSFSLPSIVPDQYVAMGNTLKTGQWFLVDRRIAARAAWKRGQVVRYEPPAVPSGQEESPWLARIAALAGETVAIRDGRLFVDGQPCQWEGFIPLHGEQMPAFRVPADHVFLLVDRSQIGAQIPLDGRAFGTTPVLALEGALFGFRQ